MESQTRSGFVSRKALDEANKSLGVRLWILVSIATNGWLSFREWLLESAHIL
jgi:hypothetical protein